MNGTPLQRLVRINNPQGLHMRPSVAFAQLALRYQSSVTLHHEENCANGKSPLDLMMLAAPLGTELLLCVEGPDAEVALEVLARQLESVPEPDPSALSPGG